MVAGSFLKKNRTKKKTKTSSVRGFDVSFLLLLLLLLCFGLVMLFSAGFANAFYTKQGDSLYYIKRQAVFAVVGIICMLVISRIDYHIIHKFALPLYGVSIVLLVLVYFMPEINGVHRWIVIPGIRQTFQPSEIAKVAIIFLFAHLVSLNYDKMKTFKHGVAPFIAFLAPIVLLVVFETHISATVLILFIAMVIMFVGGTDWKWFAGGAVAAASGIVLVIVSGLIKYAMPRINGWLHPFSDTSNDTYQTVQSLLAIGSGGVWGQGLGNSRQKYLFLPEPQNDFIFAIICEELGFIGAVLIILLFVLLTWRGFVIAFKAPDKFGCILTVGLISQIAIQALLNIAVVTNTVPNTGISLPFFSYGGTSLLMLLAQMGVILSVSRQAKLEQ